MSAMTYILVLLTVTHKYHFHKMTILHVFSPDNTLASAYIDMLTKATGNNALMLKAGTATEVSGYMQDNRPQIVHLHGDTKIKLPQNCRLVITPHGEQSEMLQTAYIVVARSDMERDLLKKRCTRVETVLNPLITRTITPEECSEQMMAIYRRVMDSYIFQLMDANTREAFDAMMLLSITGDRRWLPHKLAHRYELSNNDLRQIGIFSRLEGISDYVCRSAELLGLSIPELTDVSCYLPEGYKTPKPIDTEDITKIMADIQNNGLSVMRLLETAKALRSDSLDEEQLLAQTGRQQNTPELEALLQILEENGLITEGFMPCKPADNSIARQMRYQLQNRQSPFYNHN
jgi:hypothetical protein